MSDTCGRADSEPDRGRETERERDDEGRRLSRIRLARVKLETYLFNMSYLSILSVKIGPGGGDGGSSKTQHSSVMKQWTFPPQPESLSLLLKNGSVAPNSLSNTCNTFNKKYEMCTMLG